MRTILKIRWLMPVLWLAAAVGLMLTAPNMEELVREKGQIEVPDGYSSSAAAKLLDEMGGDAADGSKTAVLVFHNASGLTDGNMADIKQGLDKLKAEGEAYGITSVTSHYDNKELEKQMVAADGKTVLALIGVDFGGRTPAEARDALYAAAASINVEHYYTGGWIISEDVVQSSQEGLKKTELITVAFILIILFIVFRSVAAPFIPLLAVGFSYLISQSVVAFLVEYAGFPLSTFTQIFMVAVLFGIGTDYCILLISRFKEELAQSGDKTEAILQTYRTAGRTVLFSGLAVLVGFVSIGFSTFVLYRSAVAVAVGVAVMLIALVTLVPFFLSVFGQALFWPSKGSIEHKPSRLWGAVGSFSLKEPVWAMLVIAVLMVPFLAAFRNTASFNSLDEIGDKYDSVKAFNLISESFGPGESLPTTVVVKVDEPLDTQAGLAAVEQVSRELAKVDGVKAVRSATRPTGEPLADLQVTEQSSTLGDGIGQSEDGLGQIGQGLSEASGALSENAPKLQAAAAGAGELVAGTERLKAGIAELRGGLKRIGAGLNDGSAGAGELAAGAAQAKASADRLSKASQELLASYGKLGGGLTQLSKAYADTQAGQAALAAGLVEVESGLGGLGQTYPELQKDPDYIRLQDSVSGMKTNAAELSAGLKQLNGQLAGISGGLEQANAGLSRAAAGQAALTKGLASLSQGLAELQDGLGQAAGGQSRIMAGLPALSGGIDGLAAGQRKLQSGLAQLNDQLGELASGLDQSVSGLGQVTDGLQSAQSYLDELAGSPDKQLTGWFIPAEAIARSGFQAALDVYLSEDRRIAKFDVVFEGNPYELNTMAKIDDLKAAADRALQGTPAGGGAEVAVGGVTSVNEDLRSISAADYSRTVVLMLIGITLILILLFRSVVIPIYLVLSLLLTYYTSVAIAEVIFVRVVGLSGISWAVPFFGFVMLMALGIDYSIFLMDRFKEYRHLKPAEAILLAMRKMGSVIMSAALILGGTFAAMLPSGVMSLLQIATIVLCGLFLYALVVLPLFIPVMVRSFGEANWWPFMKREGVGGTELRGKESLTG